MQNQILCNLFQFSEDFRKKLFLCLSSDSNKHLKWIFTDIIKNKSMEEIAKKYIIKNNWDGKYLSSSSASIFYAFICYKNNYFFDKKIALYLCIRNGIIGSYKTFDKYGELEMIFLGPRDFIRELDGEDFFVWLSNLADTADIADIADISDGVIDI